MAILPLHQNHKRPTRQKQVGNVCHELQWTKFHFDTTWNSKQIIESASSDMQ